MAERGTTFSLQTDGARSILDSNVEELSSNKTADDSFDDLFRPDATTMQMQRLFADAPSTVQKPVATSCLEVPEDVMLKDAMLKEVGTFPSTKTHT